VSLPSSYRSRRGHIHLPRVLPLVGCRSKTPTAATSPERAPPRPPPPGAAEGARRRHHRPNHGSKSSLGNPWTTPRPFPVDPAAGAHRNCAARAGHRPEDHIARPQFFPRADLQTEGVSVRNQKPQGSFSQNGISNSICALLILVKSI
jgi:hypothetical protein